MTRRDALAAALLPFLPARALAAPVVSTLIGTGAPGHSDAQVNNPYGVAHRPGRRAVLLRSRTTSGSAGSICGRVATPDVAGNGQRGYARRRRAGHGGSLNMPHEIAFDRRGHLYIAERDSHVVRKVDGGTGRLSTLAGTGTPASPATAVPRRGAQLRQPHSIAIAPDGRLLICDVGNHRLRAVDLATGTIDDDWRHRRAPADAGRRAAGGYAARTARARWPSIATARSTWRCVKATRSIASRRDGTHPSPRRHRRAGLRRRRRAGAAGDARPARRASPSAAAASTSPTPRTTRSAASISTRGIITTVLGTGTRGDGPDGDPRRCALARPHGVCAGPGGVLYVGDSEAHRIRVLAGGPP